MTAKLDIDYSASVENILHIISLATPNQVMDGMTWYDNAHAFARGLDKSYRRSAGIIAALSPQTSWPTNQMLARRAYADGTASGSLGQSVFKANAILDGANPDDILGGDKVRSFFDNILKPKTSQAVTIDRHAHDIAVLRKLDSKRRPLLERKGGYELFVSLYKLAGKELNISGLQAQAIAWVVWRELTFENGLIK